MKMIGHQHPNQRVSNRSNIYIIELQIFDIVFVFAKQVIDALGAVVDVVEGVDDLICIIFVLPIVL